MTTEHISEAEILTNCDENDEEFEIELKITPLLTFASGPAPEVQPDPNNNLFELQKLGSLDKFVQSDHNYKQTNASTGGENEVATKAEKRDAKSQKGKVKNVKLQRCSESNANDETTVSPESSPRPGRSRKMALIRSLSSSAASPEEVPQRQTRRRLSDPTVPCQKNLVKGAFDRQGSLKKLRPYLKRKAVSPLHLLGKVASSTGSKHNHDGGHFKDSKGSNKARLARRLYPSFSKGYEQLTHLDRRGSCPSEGGVSSSGNGYETKINDFSSQIQDLAVNLENLNASDRASREYQENSCNNRPQRSGDSETKSRDENSKGNFFKEDDVHLQEMLEEVLRSHLLTMDDYSPPSCARASRSICKIITRLLGGAVKRTGDGQRKLACLVYIGAVRDNGIQMAAQALWCPEEDTFATAGFRNESVYGLAVVIATPT